MLVDSRSYTIRSKGLADAMVGMALLSAMVSRLAGW